jgi:hypothetical protein
MIICGPKGCNEYIRRLEGRLRLGLFGQGGIVGKAGRGVGQAVQFNRMGNKMFQLVPKIKV